MRASAGRLLAGLALISAMIPLAHADSVRGERVFQRCYACHSVVAGEDKLPGPNLRGVLGRRAGTLPGFRFSPPMTLAGIRGLVWTRAMLDAFLRDPLEVVPGTEMSMPGLSSAVDRRDVIDYLESAGRTAGGAAVSRGSLARPLGNRVLYRGSPRAGDGEESSPS